MAPTGALARSVYRPSGCEGGGGDAVATVTFAEATTIVPAELLHVTVKVESLLRAAVLAEPEVDWLPDQAPDAVQFVALVDDHVSVDVLPEETLVGLADIVAVGTAGAGAVAEATAMFTDAPALAPAELVQVSTYVALAFRGPVDIELDVALLPDQLPEAVHDAAFAEDHVTVEVPPDATFIGLAEIVAVGAAGFAGGLGVVGDDGEGEGFEGVDGAASAAGAVALAVPEELLPELPHATSPAASALASVIRKVV